MSKIEVPEPILDPPVLFADEELVGPEDRRIVATAEEIEATEEAAKAADEDVTELTAEERNLFRTLLTIGRRSKTIDIMGHEVVVKSLTNADEMRIGLYTKDYLGSNGFMRAHQCALVASSIESVEGVPFYTPLSDKESADDVFDKKVKKVSDMYPIVISQIYDGLIALEAEFVDLARKLGKLPG